MENINTVGPAKSLEEKSFDDVAKEIIRKSFRSAICIDNEYASAYSLNTALNADEPRALYNSFRNDAFCDLDIFEFTTFDDSWKEHMGENKDLMILDWELDPGEKHESTLKILANVISAKKIPFVVIYTNTEDVDSIARVLISKFNPVNEQQFAEFKELFNTKMAPITDTNSADLDSLLEKPEIFFEYIHFHTKREESEKRILEWIAEALGIKSTINGQAIKSKVATLLTQVFPFLVNGRELEHLAFLILHDDIKKHVTLQRVKIERSSYLFDGTTTVVIFRKKDKDGGITPEKLFNEFAQTIINDPHNFISLLSLEMKDNIKENFSNIGAKFSKIDERAFLYHIGNYQKDGDFNKGTIYDFILRGWI